MCSAQQKFQYTIAYTCWVCLQSREYCEFELRSLRNFFIGEYVFVKIITNSQCVHNKNYLWKKCSISVPCEARNEER